MRIRVATENDAETIAEAEYASIRCQDAPETKSR